MLRLLSRLLLSGPHVLKACSALIQIQLEILKLEIALEKQRLFDSLFMLLTGWMSLTFGAFMLSFLVLTLSWDAYKIPSLGILTFLFLSIGAALILAARRKIQGRDPGHSSKPINRNT